MVCFKIASDLEGQLDTISEVPEQSIRFSPDGRLPHTPSLVRFAAWDERFSGVEEGGVLSTPRICGKEEHAGLSLPVANARGAKKAARCPPPSGIAALTVKLSSRQQCCLIWKISPADWPLLNSVELFSPRPFVVQALRCWEFPPLRARQAAQRYARLALCLEQALGPAAFVFRSSQFARSLHKAICFLVNPSNLPKFLLAAVLDKPRNSRPLEEEFEVGSGVVSSEMEYTEVLTGGGSGGPQRLGGRAQMQRILRTRHEYPGLIIAAHETRVREDRMTFPWEVATSRKGTPPSSLWAFPDSTKRHRDDRRSPPQGQNRRIRTTRYVEPDFRDTRSWSEGHWRKSGVGLSVARTVRSRPDVHWSPAEASAVVAWHREADALESAKKQLMTPIGKATPKVKNELPSDDDDNLEMQIRGGKADPSGETAKTGRHGCEGQRRRGKLRPSRDFREADPARHLDRSHPRHQNGWPMFFFSLLSSFSRETEFTKFVCEETATARPRHTSRRRRIPMPASARHRALQPPRSTSGDCRLYAVLSRTAQQWRYGPS